MFDDDERKISLFTPHASNEIIDVCELVFHDLLVYDEIKEIKKKYKITQNGNFAEFTYSICLHNGKTEEEMQLQAYIATNPKYVFNLNKVYISPEHMKIYEPYGYKKNKDNRHFILKHVNNKHETYLMDEEKFIKIFT